MKKSINNNNIILKMAFTLILIIHQQQKMTQIYKIINNHNKYIIPYKYQKANIQTNLVKYLLSKHIITNLMLINQYR